MMLTTVTYYIVERDEDERHNHWFDAIVTKALAWWPEPYAVAPEVFERGKSALRTLAQGDAVSPERMACAIAYVRDSIAFYENNPWGGLEPFEGRNQLAIVDLNALLAEIDVTVGLPA
jgi:hypothetical protein